jgi:hypothetical protein
MGIAKSISVAVVVGGIHQWPAAPDHREYLRGRHHHFFRIEATAHVDHANRQIEFHDLQWYVRRAVIKTSRSTQMGDADFGTRSCEQIAEDLLRDLEPNGVLSVTVREDEFCSGTSALAFSRPTVVCLCGSTRFQKAYREAEAALEHAGYIVLSIGSFPSGAEKDGSPDVKRKMDDLHLQKIDLADQVMVIDANEEGEFAYVGSSTEREIAYARRRGKPVLFWRDYSTALRGAGTWGRDGGETQTE